VSAENIHEQLIDFSCAFFTRLSNSKSQHAFLSVASESALAVGNIIAFGISHPCTCLDRWRVILGLDADGVVARALPTQFG